MTWGIICLVFLILLFAGVPIACVMVMAAALGAIAFSGYPDTVVVQQIYAGLNNYNSLAVPFFVISGGIAAAGGTSRSLIKIMQVLFGKFRGSLAIATILASAFFAAITGTTLATIVAIGAIMIPSLVEAGYPKRFTYGLVAAGGTLGILIPPSIPMVNLSTAMGASITRQFTAGFVPGILIALIWCAYSVFYCKKHDIVDAVDFTKEEKKAAIKDGIFAIMYPVIILGSIYGGFATPTEAAAISIIYVVAVELIYYREIKIPEMFKIAGNSAITSGTLLMLVSGSKVISWYVAANQIPAKVAGFISANISNRYVLLLLLVVCFCILGCFLDIIPLSYILGPILSTTLIQYDVDFALFGVLCILCVQIGNLTPPFGLCLYMVMGITKEKFQEVAKGTLPFIITLVAFTLLCVFCPKIVMWLPDWLQSVNG